MKKQLFYISLFLIPLYSYSQTQVILKSGVTIDAQVESFLGETLTFSKKIDQIGSNEVNINEVARLNGIIPAYRMNAILKKNPEIIINNKTSDGKVVSVNYIPPTTFSSASNHSKTSGDHIKKAGTLYITGEVLTLLGGGISALALIAEDEITSDIFTLAGGLTTISGGVCVIIGHVQLIKGGKAMNNAGLAFGQTDYGIGFSLKF